MEPLETKPWIRIVLNEEQVPLMVAAVRTQEYVARRDLRTLRSGGDLPEFSGVTAQQTEIALKRRMKLLKMTREMIIEEARAKGWYA